MKPIATHRKQRGQSMVLIALMLVGLVAFVGLALDGGQAYEMRRQTQNAADAGALAAVTEVAMGQNSLVYYRINQYVVGNANVGNGATSFTAEYYSSGGKFTPVPVSPGVPPPLGTNCVRVTALRTFNTLMISFLGFSNMDVSATASGCFGVITHPTTNLWPIAVYAQNFQKNVTYNLYGGGLAAPGQFSLLSYDGNMDANSLWPKFQSGYPGPYRIYNSGSCDGSAQSNATSLGLPNCIQGAPGAKAADQGPMASQLNKTVIVPIYDGVTVNGANTYYRIATFAAFYLTGVCLQGGGAGDCSGTSGKNIKGQFVNYVVTGQFCDPQTDPKCPPDMGLKTVKLSQ